MGREGKGMANGPARREQTANVTPKADIRVEEGSVTFWMRVKPRSSRERLTMNSSGEPRLEVHAPPTDGQANEACIEYFARVLRLSRNSISITSGEKSKRKLIRLVASNPLVIVGRLHALMEEDQ